AEVMYSRIGHERVIRPPVHRIGETGSEEANDRIDAQVLAPGICGLEADSMRWAHRDLCVQPVIVVAGVVAYEIDRGELRIRHDEVLRKFVHAKHSTVYAGRSGRQSRIEIGR